MEGMTCTVAEYTFKGNYQVITLVTKSAIKIDGITVQLDPQLLFQKLTLAAKATDNIKDVFKYELCSYPPALFDTSCHCYLESYRSHFYLLTQGTPEIPEKVQFVLDGGFLAQHIQWKQFKGLLMEIYVQCTQIM